MNMVLTKLAWRNLRRNIRRSIATGMAIAAGFTAFMIAAGYAFRVERVLGAYTQYALHVGHMGIYKKKALEMYSIKPNQFSLTTDEQKAVEDALSQISSVEMSGKYLVGQGLMGNGCKTFPFVADGVDLRVESRVKNHPNLLAWNPHITELREGDPIWTVPLEIGPVAISEGLAKLLGKTKLHRDVAGNKTVLVTDCAAPEAKDLIASDANVQLAAGTWDGTLSALDGEFVMRFTTGLVETNNTTVVLPVERLQMLLNTDHIMNFSVWLKEPLFLLPTLDKLRDKLKKTAPELEVLPWTDERLSPYYSGTMHFIYVMVGFVGFVLALVVILSIFNSATMTAIERSQEVGMFRSVGYNQKTIRKLFILEGLFLTVASVLAGAILGLLTMWTINKLDITIHPPGVAGGISLMFAPNSLIILTGAIFVGVLGMLSTWLAVASIVKKNIANLVSGAAR
jgi:putative ABC transport system permease protein